ncbi:MAG TPA: Calx-beta domain-containing protein [Thermoanaerobaculia bacterium]|nr:Calx-beta domain-containing protein [Thermoanaerobaculia bacterium]
MSPTLALALADRSPRQTGAAPRAGLADETCWGPCCTSLAVALVVALVASLALATAPARAENHRVRVLNNRFDPAVLDIQPGDTVTWTNDTGMAHNVRADNDTFRCAEGCDDLGAGADPSYDPSNPGDAPGDPSTSWSATVEFDRAGDVPYYCEVHGAQGGVGMSGVVRVASASGESAGTIQFTAALFTVREDRGPAVVRVSRDGGAAGAVSVRLTASGGSATEGVDFTPVSEVVAWSDGATGERSVQVPILDDSIPEPAETVALTLSEPTGGATLGARTTSQIRIEDDDGGVGGDGEAGDGGALALVASASAALEGGAPARVAVTRTGSTQGRVTVDWAVEGIEATSEDLAAPTSGTLIWEAGDGEPKEIEVGAVADGVAEGAESARLALSRATNGAALGAPSALEVFLVDPEDGPCTSDQQRLCLNAGRFVVRVDFAPPDDDFGEARAVELTDDSGYFTFFDADNVETVVKALDACGFSQTYWIFAAGLTNVAVRLTAIDTLAGEARVYVNPQGVSFVPIQDTAAFATCP